MTPTELLAEARSLRETPHARSAGVWPRASAFMARQALESALDGVWESHVGTAGLIGCSMPTQLLCASTYLDRDLAGTVSWTWAALSRACHHHPYDLAPTAAELDRWMNQVAELVERISQEAAATD